MTTEPTEPNDQPTESANAARIRKQEERAQERLAAEIAREIRLYRLKVEERVRRGIP